MAIRNVSLNISILDYGGYTHSETIGTQTVEQSRQQLEYMFPNATNFNNHFIVLSED